MPLRYFEAVCRLLMATTWGELITLGMPWLLPRNEGQGARSIAEAVQSFDRPSQLLCAYSRQSTVKIYRVGGVPALSYKESSNGLDEDARHGGSSAEQNMATGELLDSNTTERCPRNSHFCYSLWQEDPVNKTIIVVTQG
ncbi:hypothetical protein IscW_ISCW012101 [Ixodes scapularis]|uniref:Uncharacterized protein n=1 Tax=Ixodes scapularis TaxID=6945 RepID=B7QGF6_IXOSC|nr:hypothetical protein IscW_ISCW012101 [Ixodes scapularis]|eukprot:XP_002401553.1 hypothetical protein IscW_ISCW012101 [Ixodes scapularis]